MFSVENIGECGIFKLRSWQINFLTMCDNQNPNTTGSVLSLICFFLRHRPACLIFFSFDFFYWFSHFQPLVLTLFYYYFILSNFIHHHFISFELDFIIYFSLFFCRFIMILNKLFVIWLCLILWVLLFFLSYTWIKNSFIKNKVIKTSRVHKPDYWFDMLTWVNWELAFIFFCLLSMSLLWSQTNTQNWIETQFYDCLFLLSDN